MLNVLNSCTKLFYVQIFLYLECLLNFLASYIEPYQPTHTDVGWHQQYDTRNTFLFGSPTDAHAYCRQLRMNLLSLNSEDLTQLFADEPLQQAVWLARDPGADSNWYLSTLNQKQRPSVLSVLSPM